jgi:hypothetical protein
MHDIYRWLARFGVLNFDRLTIANRGENIRLGVDRITKVVKILKRASIGVELLAETLCGFGKDRSRGNGTPNLVCFYLC